MNFILPNNAEHFYLNHHGSRSSVISMESLRSKFNTQSPGGFFLEKHVSLLEGYLKSKGWLNPDDYILSIQKPGEGNMNLVFRVVPAQAPSFIIKQARPWVEKYPELEAPTARIEVEFAYYRLLAEYEIFKDYSPEILGFDPTSHLLVIQDFGKTADFSFVYRQDSGFQRSQLVAAIHYLNQLKSVTSPAHYPDNRGLRRLNHQHIFLLPFQWQECFKLDEIQPGLQDLAIPCKHDPELRNVVKLLGQSYLSRGTRLLHGDFYPGSLLQLGPGLKVIDPEFSFVGPEEWDIAVFTAHLILSRTSEELIIEAYEQYEKSNQFHTARFSGFVGVEVLRRLVGLAQLPLSLNLEQKRSLITQAVSWIKKGKIDFLEAEHIKLCQNKPRNKQ